MKLKPQDANTAKIFGLSVAVSSATDKPEISPLKSATIRRSCLDDLKKFKCGGWV